MMCIWCWAHGQHRAVTGGNVGTIHLINRSVTPSEKVHGWRRLHPWNLRNLMRNAVTQRHWAEDNRDSRSSRWEGMLEDRWRASSNYTKRCPLRQSGQGPSPCPQASGWVAGAAPGRGSSPAGGRAQPRPWPGQAAGNCGPAVLRHLQDQGDGLRGLTWGQGSGDLRRTSQGH